MLRLSTLTMLLVGTSFLAACGAQPVAEAASPAPYEGQSVARSESENSEATGRILPVSVIPITLQDQITYPRDFVGRIVAGRETQLGFEVSGRIVRLDVNVGDRVARGDVIGRVSSERRNLTIQQAEAQKQEIEARLTAADKSLSRVRDLEARGYATRQESDDALAARDALQANIDALDRQIALGQQDLRDTVLRAPFAGSITARMADQGAVVAAGQSVVTLLSDSGLEAEIGVPPQDVRDLSMGQQLSLRSREASLQGTILRIGRDIDTSTRTVALRLALNLEENGPYQPVPGDLISVSIPKSEPIRAAEVPLSSLNQSWRGLWSVYIVEGDSETGAVRRKDVEIVAVDETSAFIRGTIESGDRLITATTDRFVPGQIVRAVKS